MHTSLYLALGFLLASLLVTFLMSDLGSKVTTGWASLWCPESPKMPIFNTDDDLTGSPAPGNYGSGPCMDRVLGITGSALSLAMILSMAYAIIWMWKSKNNNNNGNYSRIRNVVNRNFVPAFF